MADGIPASDRAACRDPGAGVRPIDDLDPGDGGEDDCRGPGGHHRKVRKEGREMTARLGARHGSIEFFGDLRRGGARNSKLSQPARWMVADAAL